MRVFISYAFDESASILAGIVNALQSKNIRFWHHSSMAAGKPLVLELRRAISESSLCIYVATKKSTASDWCKAETGAFWGVGTPIVVYSPTHEVAIKDLPPQLQDSVFVSDVTSLLVAVAEHLTREEFEVTGSGYDIPEFGRTVAAFSVLPPNAYVIPRGKFTVAGDLLRIEVQLDTKTPKGQIETCQLQGSGHIRATFATLEYSLTQGTATIWGGVLCLEYRPFAPTYSGYFLTRHAWDETHFASGMLEFHRTP